MSNDELPIQQLGSPKNIDKTQYLDPIFDIMEP